MPRQEESTRRGSLNLLGIEAGGIPAAERVIEIPVSSVRPNPHQPRRQFPQESLLELAGSIKAHGLQQPIIVRLLKLPAAAGGAAAGPAYELIVGERRLRAHQLAGLKVIRAILRSVADDHLLRLAIVENIHREDLPFMDRAVAFCRFKDQFHAGKVEPASEDLKISRRTGFNYSKLGTAEPEYQA
ncbi:MAG: ParB/RepB/Spo0J family partition protein, partial [Dehalococcoidales bacterium]|nr:ParB/RepB/Spo0J family partition protein [Dehalococcoidales bacterium]